ncbi:NAD-dependent epimerase/dehydratase family protein [Cellulomonas fengjieae]|uniref:NAD-dependent epimerase/dehydratase family protein n=1 Tax=Cellulomonas fengjieae TaxID=2819978 RepID=UPI001AAFF270|nr:NAD-dependent epimerase/dehydratase family protein [Cellulomonas fengjieae]MBO3100627.1 NAD-dependent epimerase/dehydratase family protein [Cellulomonas fengjieae]
MSAVLVIGGTGLLGYHTTLELVSRGYQVTSLSLPPMPVEDLFPAGVENVLADVTELTDDELLALLDGKHAVFYAAGADERVTPPIPAARYFHEANVLPTQRLARLARQAGVAKFVLYGSYTAEFAELWPDLGYRTRNGYPRTRLAQEELAYLEGDGAMDVMTLRLPYIFGTMPGRTPLWQMFIDIVRGSAGFVAASAGSTSAVTVTQVAQAAVGAMERGRHGGRYAINGYELTYVELYRAVCEAIGRDPDQVAVVPYEATRATLERIDAQTAAAGVEHGIHLVDSGLFQERRAVSDPADSQPGLGYADDDIPAALAATLRYCVARESEPVPA